MNIHCSAPAGGKGGTIVTVIKEFVDFHCMEPLFFSLHQEKVGESIQTFTGTIRGHCQVYMSGVELEIHLFIKRVH